jgi:hypothetical protein
VRRALRVGRTERVSQAIVLGPRRRQVRLQACAAPVGLGRSRRELGADGLYLTPELIALGTGGVELPRDRLGGGGIRLVGQCPGLLELGLQEVGLGLDGLDLPLVVVDLVRPGVSQRLDLGAEAVALVPGDLELAPSRGQVVTRLLAGAVELLLEPLDLVSELGDATLLVAESLDGLGMLRRLGFHDQPDSL